MGSITKMHWLRVTGDQATLMKKSINNSNSNRLHQSMLIQDKCLREWQARSMLNASLGGIKTKISKVFQKQKQATSQMDMENNLTQLKHLKKKNRLGQPLFHQCFNLKNCMITNNLLINCSQRLELQEELDN
jgi:hypothetical protein